MATAGPGFIIPSAVGLLGQGGSSSRLQRSIGPLQAQVTIEEKHEDVLEITEHPIEQGASISDHAFKRPVTCTLRVGWSNSPTAASGLLGSLSALLNSAIQGQVGNILNRAISPINGSGLPVDVASSLSQGLLAGGAVAFSQLTNNGAGVGTTTIQDIYQQLLALQVGVPTTVNGQTVNSGPVLLDIYTGKRVYHDMLIQSITVSTDKQTENSLIATLVCKQVIIVQTQIVSVTADPTDQFFPTATQPTVNNGIKQLTPVNLVALPAFGPISL